MNATGSSPRDFGAPVGLAVSEGTIAGRHWPQPGAPRLVFAHATGFCASAYRAMLSLLAERFDVLALDLRGHGRSALPAEPDSLRDISPFARDIGEVLDQRAAGDGGKPMLAGHSLGALAVLSAAVGRRDVAGLALIEPVAVGRLVRLAAATPLWPLIAAQAPLVKGARARRAFWPDRAAARAGYARKRLFSGWAEGCLDDYLEDGLVDREGGVALACAPRWEAAVFAAQATQMWRAAAAAPAPVRVLAADHPESTLGAAARRRFRQLGAEVATLGGVSHLAPFERPDLVAGFIAGAAPRA